MGELALAKILLDLNAGFEQAVELKRDVNGAKRTMQLGVQRYSQSGAHVICFQDDELVGDLTVLEAAAWFLSLPGDAVKKAGG